LKTEIEIKLRLPGKLGKIRRRLQAVGFRMTKRRALESNILFDNSKRTLRKHGKLIRVRTTSGRGVLTYKGPAVPSKYKKRPELEIDLPSGASIQAIFTHMGYRPVFRYEKFRTEYANSSAAGKVLLDETPIGNFVEIEGTPRWNRSFCQAARLFRERLHHAQLRLQLQAPGQFGDSGRNSLRGPHVNVFDFALLKDFVITENTRLQFRWEMFNAFNTPIFGAPSANFSNGAAGQITSLAGDPRVMQFALRLSF
jgi:adenylate cyclase class 2